MIESVKYIKGIDKQTDDDFKEKKKYGKVFYSNKTIFIREGLGWKYFSLKDAYEIEMIVGSRQLRQCCGAPILQTKSLVVNCENGKMFFDVDDISDMDFGKAEQLIEKILSNNHQISFKNKQ